MTSISPDTTQLEQLLKSSHAKLKQFEEDEDDQIVFASDNLKGFQKFVAYEKGDKVKKPSNPSSPNKNAERKAPPSYNQFIDSSENTHDESDSDQDDAWDAATLKIRQERRAEAPSSRKILNSNNLYQNLFPVAPSLPPPSTPVESLEDDLPPETVVLTKKAQPKQENTTRTYSIEECIRETESRRRQLEGMLLLRSSPYVEQQLLLMQQQAALMLNEQCEILEDTRKRFYDLQRKTTHDEQVVKSESEEAAEELDEAETRETSGEERKQRVLPSEGEAIERRLSRGEKQEINGNGLESGLEEQSEEKGTGLINQSRVTQFLLHMWEDALTHKDTIHSSFPSLYPENLSQMEFILLPWSLNPSKEELEAFDRIASLSRISSLCMFETSTLLSFLANLEDLPFLDSSSYPRHHLFLWAHSSSAYTPPKSSLHALLTKTKKQSLLSFYQRHYGYLSRGQENTDSFSFTNTLQEFEKTRQKQSPSLPIYPSEKIVRTLKKNISSHPVEEIFCTALNWDIWNNPLPRYALNHLFSSLEAQGIQVVGIRSVCNYSMKQSSFLPSMNLSNALSHKDCVMVIAMRGEGARDKWNSQVVATQSPSLAQSVDLSLLNSRFGDGKISSPFVYNVVSQDLRRDLCWLFGGRVRFGKEEEERNQKKPTAWRVEHELQNGCVTIALKSSGCNNILFT